MNNIAQSIVGVLILLTWFAALVYCVASLAEAWWSWVVLGGWALLAAWRLWQIVAEWHYLRDLMEILGMPLDNGQAFYDVEGTEPFDG